MKIVFACFFTFIFYSTELTAQADENYSKGLKAFDENEYEKAIFYFEKVISEIPLEYEAYFNRGICFYKLNEIDKACVDLKFAMKMSKGYTTPEYKLYCDSTSSDDNLEMDGVILPEKTYPPGSPASVVLSEPQFPGGLHH